MEIKKYIDTETFSSNLREKGIDLIQQKVLMTNFNNTKQIEDLTLPPNCGGFGRIHHFRKQSINGFPLNPLPIEPAERFLGKPLGDIVKVQVFQNAICSWRCWYCFVDYKLLGGDMKYSSFMSVDELIDLYLLEEDKCQIIDLSGGQPDLVPELSIWFADALKKRDLEKSVFLWSDDNLSNDYLWRYLTKKELSRLSSYPNYSRVGCFKGFDPNSFSFNTKADPSLFYEQIQIMSRLVKEGFDIYGYVTLTSLDDSYISNKVSDFMDMIQQKIHHLFPLRTVPLQIFEFTPTKLRMTTDHIRSMKIQEQAVIAWNEELSKRFSKELILKNIVEHSLS